MLSKGQAIVQGTYFLLFLAMSIKLAGSFDLGVTPNINWPLFAVVSFLTVGKIVYWILKECEVK